MARRDRYDVYICPGAPTMLSVMALFLYTRLQGTATLVWWGRNLRPKRDAGRVGQLLRDLTKYVRGPLYRSASCCLCYGTAAAGYFQSFGAPESDTFIAYNSTDTTRQREVERCCRNDPSLLDAIRDEYDLIGRTIITFAGTLTDEKNVDNLIDIQRKLLGEGYDTSLVVAGDGPELGRLRDYASDVDHVHFTGWLKTDRLARVLLVTDLFVMPGHGGLAVQEAMALRNPVVTVPLDGTERDLIQQGKNGYVVGHGSTDTLYSAVTAVLNEPESVRDEMGLRSREIIDNRVNIDRMVDGFRQAIETASNENTVTRDIPVA
jgi:glycosyltransferase involved in cell wall biosynthesis